MNISKNLLPLSVIRDKTHRYKVWKQILLRQSLVALKWLAVQVNPSQSYLMYDWKLEIREEENKVVDQIFGPTEEDKSPAEQL